MDIEKESSRNRRRVSFVPVDINQQEESIHDVSVIQKEKEELRRRRELQKRNTQNNLPIPKSNTNRSLRIEEMYANIIRMSNENKINQKNTWNLDLINHMQDVIMDGSDSIETNFQKASTTLDASIKIYGYRVDDTLNTGYRILDNLNRNEPAKPQEEAPKQSKKLGVVNTIESNLRSIQMDSTEITYDADPLFHLMSRRFDEGGVKGLLLSNLGVNNGWNVVFDSNEVIEIEDVPKKDCLEDMDTFVDIQSLFGKEPVDHALQKPVCSALNPLIEEIRKYEGVCTDLDEDYQNTMEEEILNESILEDQNIELDEDMIPIPVQNHTEMDELDVMDMGAGMEMDDPMDDPMDFSQPVEGVNDQASQRTNEIEKMIMNSSKTDYHYFQPSLLTKIWAGPSYWKISKVSKPKKKTSREPTKAKKGPSITFSPDQVINPPEAFAAVKRKSDLALSDSQYTNQPRHLLPEDFHYTFNNLIRLNCRKDIDLHRIINFTIDSSHSMDIQEWELSPNNVDIGGCTLDNPMDIIASTEEPIIDNNPAEISFDVDAPMDNGMDEPSHVGFISEISEDGQPSLIQADRVVERISIAYANQATQIDIQELKDCIWDVMEGDLQEGKEVIFSDMMQKVQRRKSEEIAVQFFFICTLHISFFEFTFVHLMHTWLMNMIYA